MDPFQFPDDGRIRPLFDHSEDLINQSKAVIDQMQKASERLDAGLRCWENFKLHGSPSFDRELDE